MRAAVEGINRARRGPITLGSVGSRPPSWPARVYAYGTWAYALDQARQHAGYRKQRVWVYRALLDGEPVWVASWDPKRRYCIADCTRVAIRGGRYCGNHEPLSTSPRPLRGIQ